MDVINEVIANSHTQFYAYLFTWMDVINAYTAYFDFDAYLPVCCHISYLSR